MIIPVENYVHYISLKTHRKKITSEIHMYRGADKSLARPGRKQAPVTEDFEFHISYL
jgi:hypothetical protein